MDPLVDELGQASSLLEEQLEEVAGETSAAFYIPKAQLLHVHKWQGIKSFVLIFRSAEPRGRHHLGGLLESRLQGRSSGPRTIEVLLATIPCLKHLRK